MATKVLRVGDPHIKLNNISDSTRLIQFIYDIAKEQIVDSIEFLGDLFHNHAVKRVEIETFWMTSFHKLNELNIPILVLIGNHDQIGSKEKEAWNSLNVFSNKWDNVEIINSPRIVKNVAYIPYMRDNERLVEEARRLYQQGATKILVAHQTFTGASYDNGFYAEDGVEPELICQDSIVSGHIHTSQQIGKCFYPGTPKWDTMSDANVEKGIWIFNHEDDSTIIDKQFISTKDVVSPIYKIVIIEGDELPVLVENARNYVELHGKTSWIKKVKKQYKDKASIKIVPKDRKQSSLSSGHILGFNEFLINHFEPIANVTKEHINEYLRSLDVG